MLAVHFIIARINDTDKKLSPNRTSPPFISLSFFPLIALHAFTVIHSEIPDRHFLLIRKGKGESPVLPLCSALLTLLYLGPVVAEAGISDLYIRDV
jgi:hypothetical protein